MSERDHRDPCDEPACSSHTTAALAGRGDDTNGSSLGTAGRSCCGRSYGGGDDDDPPSDSGVAGGVVRAGSRDKRVGARALRRKRSSGPRRSSGRVSNDPPESGPRVPRQRDTSRSERGEEGFVASMAADPVFHVFPEATEDCCEEDRGDSEPGLEDRFLQKQYPMLYMRNVAESHPWIKDVRQAGNSAQTCPLCKKLDKNTLDSLLVLRPHEVRVHLSSSGHVFPETQINLHLAHSAGPDESADVLRAMAMGLLVGSYSLASSASLHVMNRVHTHMGKVHFVPDQDMAKVHNDAVKQFIGLTGICQSLAKCRQEENES